MYNTAGVNICNMKYVWMINASSRQELVVWHFINYVKLRVFDVYFSFTLYN